MKNLFIQVKEVMHYLNFFIFKKILNDEVLIYNQASLNIYGYCLEKFKNSGVDSMKRIK